MEQSTEYEWLDEILAKLLRQGYDLGGQEYGIYGGFVEVQEAKSTITAKIQALVAQREKAAELHGRIAELKNLPLRDVSTYGIQLHQDQRLKLLREQQAALKK